MASISSDVCVLRWKNSRECFFWYWPTRVVPDKRPLNGCVCVCVCGTFKLNKTSSGVMPVLS